MSSNNSNNDFPIDVLFAHHRGDSLDVLPAGFTPQLPIEMSEMLSDLDYNGIVGTIPTETDPFSNYLALFGSQAETQPAGRYEDEDCSAISNQVFRQRLPRVMSDIDKESRESQVSNTGNHQELHDSNGQSISFNPISVPSELGTTTGASLSKRGMRHPRRQNHACDQCRSSKKACNLPLNTKIHQQKPLRPCSTCNIRGLKCTVAWLTSKNSEQHARKRTRAESDGLDVEASNDAVDVLPPADREERVHSTLLKSQRPPGAMEGELFRQLNARELCLQQFNLYVDVCDMPISQSLLHGCMPPRYSLGIAALTPLSNSVHLNTYLEKANTWIQSCWEMNSTSWSSTAVAPHAFRSVSLLDSLFQGKVGQRFASSPSRDASINDAYKCVAIATAAQFSLKVCDARKATFHSRDLACATWRKARDMVFKNIAATGSFRQSLSLVLFGFIICPEKWSNEGTRFEENATYALSEGIRRLMTLCASARDSVCDTQKTNCTAASENMGERPNPIQKLPNDMKENVMELIGAVEWLAKMTNAVVIATSRGETCPVLPGKYDDSLGSPVMNRYSIQSLEMSIMPRAVVKDEEIHDSIVSRVVAEQTLMTICGNGLSGDRLEKIVRQCGSLVVLLWMSLALLILSIRDFDKGSAGFDRFQCHFEATLKLVKLWRSSIGVFDDITKARLEQLPSDTRRIVAFCLNDGDLAVLAFHDAIQRLEMDLALQKPTPEKDRIYSTIELTKCSRKAQRLMSATQVCTLASISQGISSPGLQGSNGLKSSVQDMGAHPVSTPKALIYSSANS